MHPCVRFDEARLSYGDGLVKENRNDESARTRVAAQSVLLIAALLISGEVSNVRAQSQPTPPADLTKTRLDIYGFMMLDMGFDFEQNDPDWFDVVRPTKLPAFEDEFGKDGHLFAGVRQSRFGVKTYTPTRLGELKTIFEFELFGVGEDAGQTTFRLRHAWGELGHFGAGQTGAPSWTPMCFRISWSTGVRTAWPGSATCSSAGCRFRETTSSSSHSSVQARAVTAALRRSHRAAEHHRAVSRARSHRALQAGARLGPRADRGPPAPDRLG